MILLQVAGLADAFGVELPLAMLAVRRHLEPSFRVVAVATHPGCVVVQVHVRTLGNRLAMLDDHFLLQLYSGFLGLPALPLLRLRLRLRLHRNGHGRELDLQRLVGLPFLRKRLFGAEGLIGIFRSDSRPQEVVEAWHTKLAGLRPS